MSRGVAVVRRLLPILISVIVAATCLLAANKLRATPRYDQIQVGMSWEDVKMILGPQTYDGANPFWDTFEGEITVKCSSRQNVVEEKSIAIRSPLDRLDWFFKNPSYVKAPNGCGLILD